MPGTDDGHGGGNSRHFCLKEPELQLIQTDMRGLRAAGEHRDEQIGEVLTEAAGAHKASLRVVDEVTAEADARRSKWVTLGMAVTAFGAALALVLEKLL